jgi:hypothetical protein
MRSSTALLGFLLSLALIPSLIYTGHTFAGNEVFEDLPPALGELGLVEAIATDSRGGVYLSILMGNVVMRLDNDGTLTRIAGTGTFGYSGDNESATKAQLWNPQSVAVDSSGGLYISERRRVRKVSDGMIISLPVK